MRRIVWVLLPLLLLGCGSGNYKISKEEYRDRVRTLGVAPLLVDAGSTIEHPDRQQVIDLLRRHNAGKAEELISMLRKQKGYFDVRGISGDPQQLFSRMVRESALRGEGPALYRRYQFNSAAVAELARDNVVDALLVVIANGVVRKETRRDRGPLLAYLEAPFNPILMTAAVVLPSGEIAWEYSGAAGENFLPLQFAAFDEAYYNKTDEVKIKYLSVEGLERALGTPEKDLFGGKKLSQPYGTLLEQIVAALHPGFLMPKRSPEAEKK
ncbi:MAG: hypothetical protein WDA20_13700 [Desulfuromonadales bacterium]|jgi:hypothetical protein